MNNQNITLIIPSCGSHIPVQGAAILKLKEINVIPSTICASSSGAIITSLACSSDFSNSFEVFKKNFLEKAGKIESKYYAKKWVKLLPVFLTSLYKGSLYNNGNKIPNELIDFDHEKQPLLLFGSSCIETGKQTIWISKANVDFSISDEDILFYFLCNFEIMTGKKLTEKVIRASCAIPCIVPPIKIAEKKYFDGGLESSSPFIAYNSFLTSKKNKFNVIYVYQYNIYDDYSFSKYKSFIFTNATDAVTQIINNMSWESIIYCISNIKNPNFYAGKNTFDLVTAINISKISISSFILMMPYKNVQSDILNTKKGDLSKKIEECYDKDFLFMHWYELENNFMNEVEVVL
jgi:hypothetical protein